VVAPFGFDGAGLAVDARGVVVAVRPRERTTVVEVVEVVESAAVSDGADATAVAVAGVLTASQPVITIIPVAPVTPVMRRARRAGCGRRRGVASIATIIEPQSEDQLGAA
jgi:hypothetical protein